MNWKVIVALVLLGLMMGIASLFGWTQNIELVLWIIIALVAAFWIATNKAGRPFLHGLLAGLLMGVCNSLVQFGFFEMYLANNPVAGEQFSKIPGGIQPRFFVLLVGPAVGLMYGMFLGLFALIAAKFVQRKGREEDSSVS
jgi:hypothetical protein